MAPRGVRCDTCTGLPSTASARRRGCHTSNAGAQAARRNHMALPTRRTGPSPGHANGWPNAAKA
eukprot:9370090-Lingulodinium_polyedra.AAC.1